MTITCKQPISEAKSTLLLEDEILRLLNDDKSMTCSYDNPLYRFVVKDMAIIASKHTFSVTREGWPVLYLQGGRLFNYWHDNLDVSKQANLSDLLQTIGVTI